MKKVLFLSCIMQIANCVLYAQDTRFSQPMNNPLTLNPAMMGLSNDLRLLFQHRSQWAGIDKGYQTSSVSFMYPLFLKDKDGGKSRLDFGLNVISDRAGAFNRLNTNLSVSYGLQLNSSNYLNSSINVGYLQNTLNLNSLTFDEQFQYGVYSSTNTSNESFSNVKAGALDAGLGLLWYYRPTEGKVQAFAGISGFHLNQPNMSFTGGTNILASRMNFQAGAKIVGDIWDINPILLYNVQGSFKQFIGGILMDYKLGGESKMVMGIWYKERDAISLQVGYEHKSFFFAYSYDFGNSELNRNISGLMTHEITLAYKMNRLKNVATPQD